MSPKGNDTKKVNDKEVNKMDEKKQELLDQAIAQIEKVHGKGSIMKLGSDYHVNVDVIPTGCLSLDSALGVGGLPRGRIIEIYGPESSGKTTVSLHVVAEAQKLGGAAAFIDAEHALDPVYAAKLGVNLDELYISQPDNGEQALDIAEYLVRSGAVDIIVIDSVAALTPKAEIEGDISQQHVGLQARLMSSALRKLTAIVNKTKTCVIFINQLREKVGIMFGNPEVTPGGKALKFYSSVRLDVRKKDPIKDGSAIIGNHTTVKVVKNKLAPPFRVAEFDIIYGSGISTVGCIVDMAIEENIFKKSGSWISYNDEKIAQGRDKCIALLKENKELMAEVSAKVRANLTSLPVTEDTSDSGSDDE